MAGEIKLNSVNFATESAGTVTVSNVDSATNRTNLGLGSIATQAADNVSISGGNITGGTIGGSVLFPAGHVIQVKQFLYTSVYDVSLNGSSVFLPAPLGDGSAYIQMGSSSNKVLITIQLHYGHETSWRSNFAQVYTNNFTSSYDTGNETLITGSGNAGTTGSNGYNTGGNTITSSILYSPNTTNKAGFRIKVFGHTDGGNLHLNQNNQNNSTANNNTFSISSSITLQEISS